MVPIQSSARSTLGQSSSASFRSPVVLDVASYQPQKQRRRIDTSIVAAERNFAGVRHLARAHLMDDLARLLVARLVDSRCLAAPRACAALRAASSGKNGSTDSAVMMLSRPNSVANHGMPAMMKRRRRRRA